MVEDVDRKRPCRDRAQKRGHDSKPMIPLAKFPCRDCRDRRDRIDKTSGKTGGAGGRAIGGYTHSRGNIGELGSSRSLTRFINGKTMAYTETLDGLCPDAWSIAPITDSRTGPSVGITGRGARSPESSPLGKNYGFPKTVFPQTVNRNRESVK